METIADKVQQHKNLIQSTSGTIASIGLEKVGQKAAGYMVTPAVWVLNYSTQGSTPDKTDMAIWATGFISAGASIAVGLVKAVVDDDMDTRVREIQSKENSTYSPYIKACFRYGSAAPQINAMKIASSGGTAWRAPNGLWVYLTDAEGKLVSDFTPNSYVELYRPQQPLTKARAGGLVWNTLRKR